jgi:hypothetical protein
LNPYLKAFCSVHHEEHEGLQDERVEFHPIPSFVFLRALRGEICPPSSRLLPTIEIFRILFTTKDTSVYHEGHEEHEGLQDERIGAFWGRTIATHCN